MAVKFQDVPYLIKTPRLFYPHEIINISSNIFPLGRCRKTKAVEFPTCFTVFASETRKTQTAILFVRKSGLAEGIVVAMILITSTLKGKAKQFSGQAMLWLCAIVQFINAMIRSSTPLRWRERERKRVGQKMTLSLLRVPRTKYYNLNFFISSPWLVGYYLWQLRRPWNQKNCSRPSHRKTLLESFYFKWSRFTGISSTDSKLS